MKGLQISVMEEFMDYAKVWLSAKQVKMDATLDESLVNNYSVIPRNKTTQISTKSHIAIYDTIGIDSQDHRTDDKRILVLKFVPTDP
ncbi:hypothetical protein CRE_24202 [Caenorhabditis remanei]|uniref:Uncharacterized protein n=1 Tax=Caenorhabditis remanei TaxID=31234 RepID=E3NCW0_CAERE|nr:hypothetical protein CRE_24202 [Caenorhabditis remanei]